MARIKEIDEYSLRNQIADYVNNHDLFDPNITSQYVLQHGIDLSNLNLSQAIMILDEIVSKLEDHVQKYNSTDDPLINAKIDNVNKSIQNLQYEVKEYFTRSLREIGIT